MQRARTIGAAEYEVRVSVGPVTLEGNLGVPAGARGAVLFAHGSGSGRYSPRNRFVARQLRDAGVATLLVDLLTQEEEAADQYTGHLRFDICLLAERLVGATDWLAEDRRTVGLSVGYFGASTGGGASLVAAARRPDRVGAVVSRGGLPDLAGAALPAVRAPTLLIVGGDEGLVIRLNEGALAQLGAPVKRLVVVPGASHLFEEPGKLEEVARLAADWFSRHFDLRDEVMALVRQCHDEVRRSSPHVHTSIRIEDEEGGRDQLTRNIASIEERLGRPLRKLDPRGAGPPAAAGGA